MHTWLQMFSILFFFMLFVLGIGSNIAMCSCIITILRDKFKWLKAWQAAIGLAVCGFMFGLIYVTPVCTHNLKCFLWKIYLFILWVESLISHHSLYLKSIGRSIYVSFGRLLWNVIHCVYFNNSWNSCG